MIATQFAWLNGMEIVGILIVVLILFGAKKLPELARGLGKGIQEFKKASRDVQDELHNAIESEPAPPPRTETRPADKTVVMEKTGAEPEFAEQTVPQSQSTESKA